MTDIIFHFQIFKLINFQINPGGLAQLARALALQARGHRFESDILHNQFTIVDFGFTID